MDYHGLSYWQRDCSNIFVKKIYYLFNEANAKTMGSVFKVDSDQVFELTTKNRTVTLATIGFTDTLARNPLSLG